MQNKLIANYLIIFLGKFKQPLKGRTVVVVAHRLSTIKNADQIIVLNKGFVAEIGKHDELLEKKGFYYNLVYSQYAVAEPDAAMKKEKNAE